MTHEIVALAWRIDAKTHVRVNGMTLCGQVAHDAWTITGRDVTCRECKRAYARISQPHPLNG